MSEDYVRQILWA